ncbi:hypothetical protein CG001_02225 [Mesoplasma coleopterae]|uniref:hypothetical protein n=1 Tax=Mesoplasma coleopterae TaxID=324078 RepID=UPI000D03344F|nr:hypothetical protein [Mesoplasma coleopterae]AVN62446.1 hypothetical protein CG001_02225 [Mesoplasma coleopterae]
MAINGIKFANQIKDKSTTNGTKKSKQKVKSGNITNIVNNKNYYLQGLETLQENKNDFEKSNQLLKILQESQNKINKQKDVILKLELDISKLKEFKEVSFAYKGYIEKGTKANVYIDLRKYKSFVKCQTFNEGIETYYDEFNTKITGKILITLKENTKDFEKCLAEINEKYKNISDYK